MQTELPTILNVLETDYELEYSEIYTGTVHPETNRSILVLYLFTKSLNHYYHKTAPILY